MLPGFVDTHRHVWQSALRGAAVDTDLGAYLGILARCGPKFRPQDVHTVTLAGARECLASGKHVDTVLVAGQVVKTASRLVHADLGQAVQALRTTAATVTGL